METTWDYVRSRIIGNRTPIETPFGTRCLTYADYTASGRGVSFVEDYVRNLMQTYANTHTEDDLTGLVTSKRLAAAERIIKNHLHANEDYVIIALGAGATAAINRLQEILGIYLSPAGRDRIDRALAKTAGKNLREVMRDQLPVVFVGPYEHHSNEISWREGLADVVEINLDSRGYLDLDDLRYKLALPQYANRERIGSFSAASNVSGIKTDVYEVARILHAAGALAFFDFSASAPYVDIDVAHDDESSFDGVFFSPHKYLGGPGSAGILVLRKALYRADLPPSESGGGTVSFVNEETQDYVHDIEEREKAGTPAILQTMRAALAIDLQHHLGLSRIEARETDLIRRAVERFSRIPAVEIIGDAPPEDRLSIFSFNISHGNGYLHPRFVVRLLNDLFGIQARAGCSCAGPYGHRLLEIDIRRSEIYRQYIRDGLNGLKPGWVRLNFHYLITDEEFEYLCRAIEIAAEFGLYYLSEYRFDLKTGSWMHTDEPSSKTSFGIAEALAFDAHDESRPGTCNLTGLIAYAEAHGRELRDAFRPDDLQETNDDVIPFFYMEQE